MPIIRKVQFEDYFKIKNLINRHNLKIYDQLYWENIWKKNPYLEKNNNWTFGWVIEDNNEIVGHLGNIPMEYVYKYNKYIGSIINGWVVDKSYRYLSIKLLHEYILQKNIDFLMGTTASQKTIKILTALGWNKIPIENYNKTSCIFLNLKNVIKAYFKQKKIKINNYLVNIIFYLAYLIFYKKINYWNKFNTKKKITYYKKFNSRFDVFYSKLNEASKNIFMFNRTKEWINWHLNGQFENKKAWILTEEKNNEIIGYCICIEKNNEDINLKKIVLADFAALNNDHKTYLNLLYHSICEAKKRGYDLFEAVGFNDEKRKIINKFRPFLKKMPFCPFYFKIINLELSEPLSKKDCWDPSILDGDSIF